MQAEEHNNDLALRMNAPVTESGLLGLDLSQPISLAALRELGLEERKSFDLIDFTGHGVRIAYAMDEGVIGVCVWGEYTGALPDGVRLGTSICEAEALGWRLHLDYEGWIHREHPGIVLQNEHDDPNMEQVGQGVVEWIGWEQPGRLRPAGWHWGDRIFGYDQYDTEEGLARAVNTSAWIRTWCRLGYFVCTPWGLLSIVCTCVGAAIGWMQYSAGLASMGAVILLALIGACLPFLVAAVWALMVAPPSCHDLSRWLAACLGWLRQRGSKSDKKPTPR
jgi:hypothetical protein